MALSRYGLTLPPSPAGRTELVATAEVYAVCWMYGGDGTIRHLAGRVAAAQVTDKVSPPTLTEIVLLVIAVNSTPQIIGGDPAVVKAVPDVSVLGTTA